MSSEISQVQDSVIQFARADFRESRNIQKTSAEEAVKEEKKQVDNLIDEDFVVEINQVVQSLQRDLQFSVDQKGDGVILKVLDSETQETIREIPSEEIRLLKQRLKEISGIIFRQSV